MENNLSLRSQGESTDNFYIESATLNGEPSTGNWIDHQDIQKEEMIFKMADQPNTSRAVDEAAAPFSLSTSNPAGK